ncbi:hypothetical protein OIDMADRAFT_62036 [Oidiodendron maius Zn]|uniref:Uncharacterized protein n=1 Tax=Oidiodendron maius (strain Zn) TaxID=913774 RepID=A0A0C3GA34_OIDMZ|nr:hypothetical protein OIDMADRAFT_62036 [Oidiodendron maius Zn]
MLTTRHKTGSVADSLDDALIGQLQADEEAFAADVGDDWYVDTPATLEDVLAVTPADLELEDTVQRLPALANSSISTVDRSKRLKMTVQEAYKFMKSLGTKVTVNWGKEQIDEMWKWEVNVTPAQLVNLMTSARLGKDQNPIDGPEPDDNDGAAMTGDGLPSQTLGVHITNTSYDDACEVCRLSTAKQIISRREPDRAMVPYERVHYDLFPINPSPDGIKYIAHFRCDYTKMNHTSRQ